MSPAAALLRRVCDVREGEVSALLWSFAYFFCVLCSYYILRPVREEMGISGGMDKLPWLFTAVFAAMLAAVPAFSALVARLPRRRFIPIVYRFFASNLLVFFGLLALGAPRVEVGKVFYVWLSVFNLFVVSVFWQFMADVWRSEQGKRLFGVIAAGGSAGALVGSLVTAAQARQIGTANLLLLSAALLELAVLCVTRLNRLAGRLAGGAAPPEASAAEERIGGGAFRGVTLVLGSPYLLGICAQTLFLSITATVLYFEQARIVSAESMDPARRTAMFASIDLTVNVITIVVQVLVTGRLMTRVGLGVALAVVPVVTGVGFLALAARPTLSMIAGLQGLRRAIHYAVDRPAREILFTVVAREEKYKAKSFIDTVAFRGGDAASAWALSGLSALGVKAAGLSLLMVPVAGGWVLLSRYLARRQAERARGEGG
ncbi:MFS transporter [Sorangium cellulosum]|uniref:MFS transporter n=1 Tax=Sorangium cellulosum TaxID=56 RepID=A0A150T2X5_SORCE|nr:MFS transporter [Sorangium cellulosum]KYF98906.1 MFS transporter [Sorangium cellulosum]